MLFAVLEVPLGNVGHQGVVRVRVGEEGRDREENLDDREGRRPLVLELCVRVVALVSVYSFRPFAGDDLTHNVEADSALGVDVGVVDLRFERDLASRGSVSWVPKDYRNPADWLTFGGLKG